MYIIKLSFCIFRNLIMKDCKINSNKVTTKIVACDVCKKSFKTKYSLIVHKRTHAGEKPYECIICEKSFKQKCSLTRHMLVHSGKKDFQCHVCGKYFTQKSNLKRHTNVIFVKRVLNRNVV